VTSLTVRRRVTAYETRLAAIVDDAEVGFCDVQPDLTHAGLSPAFGGWGWLTDFQVREGWRNQGIGRWLVQHAVQWLRLAGCDRIVLAVADENEAAGAGRFYRRFGWNVLVREAHGWSKASEQQHGTS
jgi:GNAT superfamily N-acetyltransferase